MQDPSREINCLSSMLSQLLLSAPDSRNLTVSNSILNLMVQDFDLSPLADKIIKLLALPYPQFKRVVCAYLIRYADNILDLNILTTNCFLKDFDDPNPFVRRLVMKTVCHIHCLNELAFHIIPLAFNDNSSYIRSTATSLCTLIINESNLESKQNIIDKLYDMIRDPDPSVVSSSLAVLDTILYSEGGIVINARLARYLLNRITEFQEWYFPIVSKVLKKYIPKSCEELLKILNDLDEYLSNTNPIIFFAAADLALFYISATKENFSSDVVEQIFAQIKFLLSHSSDELLYEVLKILQDYVSAHKIHFSQFYKLLFCRFSDSMYVKVKKLQIITDLGNSSNFSEIAEELLIHSYSTVKEIAIQSIKSFLKFAFIHPISSNVMQSFVQLLDIKYNNLNEEVLIALCSSKFHEKDYMSCTFLPAISNMTFSISSAEGKLALLTLIANYGKHIQRSPYVIEELINDPTAVQNENIMMLIIIASVQLFLVRPAEMQLLMGRILQTAEHADNLIIKKQSFIYNNLLTNISLCKKVLLPRSQLEKQ